MASPPVPPPRNPLASSSTLVIGGSTGLGFAVALGAVSQGGRVCIASSNAERLASAVAELQARAPPPQAPAQARESSGDGGTQTQTQTVFACTATDLSDPATVEAGVRRILAEATAALGGQPLDHVVWTAGEASTEPATLATVTAAGAYAAWTTRYLGPLLLAKQLAAEPGRWVRVHAASSVTLTSGSAGKRPRAGIATVVGVAGAVEALGRGLAVELAPVRCNTVLPGAVRTARLARLSPQAIAAFGEKSLVRGIGDPDDAAEAYLYCMRCAFVTGQELTVDGGAFYV